MRNKYFKNAQGFTLIEVLIVITILSILGVGVLGLQYILGQAQILTFRGFLNSDEVNRSVTDMIREIRVARAAETGVYTIEEADDNEVIFYSDIDYDNISERVRYTRTGTVLEKGIIEPTINPASYPPGSEVITILSENIRNDTDPVFTYYNDDWPEDTINNPLVQPVTLSSIKLVKVYLRINVKDDAPNDDFVLKSYVNLRTLKDNL